jgi:hypothetical protein
MKERRSFLRFKVGVQIQWKKAPSPGERSALHISQVKDVSAGGVCLVLHPGIQAGDLLELDITLPRKSPIQVKARVVWVDANARDKDWPGTYYEGGIVFLDLSEQHQVMLNQYLISAPPAIPGHK